MSYYMSVKNDAKFPVQHELVNNQDRQKNIFQFRRVQNLFTDSVVLMKHVYTEKRYCIYFDVNGYTYLRRYKREGYI